MRATGTSKAAFERMQRVSAILNRRFSGQSLAQIAAEQNVTPQAIHALIRRALSQAPQMAVAEIRALEAGRLDAMQNAIWPQALAGDVQAINAVLAIMQRRARLLGLDLRPTVYVGPDGVEADAVDPHLVKVVIEGDPEIARVQWLEERHRRLCELEAQQAEGDTPRTVN